MRHYSALLLLGSVISCSCWAETTQQRAVPDEERLLICKKVTVTGSRIRQTVCKTKAQAADEQKMGRRSVEQMRDEMEQLQNAMRNQRPQPYPSTGH